MTILNEVTDVTEIATEGCTITLLILLCLHCTFILCQIWVAYKVIKMRWNNFKVSRRDGAMG